MSMHNLFQFLFHHSKQTPPSKENKQTAENKENPQDLFFTLMRHVHLGHLTIPEGITELPDRVLDGGAFCHVGDKLTSKKQYVDKITSVTIPGTVRRIGQRAFADCTSLRLVTICEGVECIESNAFTGCGNLRSVLLPKSVRKVDGWAFYRCGLKEPVFSADGKVLVYYPQDSGETEYVVPEGVEEIGSRSFLYMENLTRITLPRSLKRIDNRAFLDCGFSELTIPARVEVASGAFVSRKRALRLRFEAPLSALEYRLEISRIKGRSFLSVKQLEPPREEYWKTDTFRTLADRCAKRSVPDMDRMGDVFAEQATREPEDAFCRAAEIFWRMRACQYGSEKGLRFLNARLEDDLDASFVSPSITEGLLGNAEGRVLNALGFLFFDPERNYTLHGVDAQGIVEVSAYCGEDGPDEDGFGRETYYDWWYLDDCLNLPEGIGLIHSYSMLDKRNQEKKFAALHDRAAAAATAAATAAASKNSV